MSANQTKEPARVGGISLPCLSTQLYRLLAIALLLLALFIGLLHITPEGQRWLALYQVRKNRLLAHLRLRYALHRDPPLGLSMKGLLPIGNISPKPTLVIVLGQCEGCSRRILLEWLDVLGKWRTLRREISGVLVVQDEPVKVAQLPKSSGGNVTIVTDRDGQIARRLNAIFLPRAYGFERGRLVWIQKTPGVGIREILMSFLTIVQGAEKAVRIIDAWSSEMREEAWAGLKPRRNGER